MSKADKTSINDKDNELEQTLPWSVKIPHKNVPTGETSSDESDEINISDIETSSDTCSNDYMDTDEYEDPAKSTYVSDYIKQNPNITQQNTDFEEVTFNQNTIIKAIWRVALIYICPDCIVECENGGGLYLAREGMPDTKIIGENSKYGASVIGEIIEV